MAQLPSALVALDAATGAVRWTAPTNEATAAVPVLHGNTVYNVTDHLYAFDATTGAALWTAPIPDTGASNARAISGSPAADDHAVHVSGADGVLRAFDSTTGAMLWQTTIGAGSVTDVALDSGVVVAVSDQGQLHGVDANSGADLWNVQLEHEGASPSAAGGVAYIGDGATVKAIGVRDGTLQASYPSWQGCQVQQPPLPSGGNVYFAGCAVQAVQPPS